jgi:hypothetical protein
MRHLFDEAGVGEDAVYYFGTTRLLGPGQKRARGNEIQTCIKLIFSLRSPAQYLCTFPLCKLWMKYSFCLFSHKLRNNSNTFYHTHIDLSELIEIQLHYTEQGNDASFLDRGIRDEFVSAW